MRPGVLAAADLPYESETRMPRPRPPLRLLLLALCALLAGAGLVPGPERAAPPAAAPAAPPAAASVDSAFGVDGAMRWPEWGTFAQPAAAVVDSGAGWVREDFAWGLIEPAPGQFAWEATDRMV